MPQTASFSAEHGMRFRKEQPVLNIRITELSQKTVIRTEMTAAMRIMIN